MLCRNGSCPDGITRFAQGPPLPAPASATDPSGQIADTLDVNFRPSYLEQFNLTLEKDISGNVLQATYVGMLGRHLAEIYNDQNVPAPISNTSLNAIAAAQRTNPAMAFNTLRRYDSTLPNVTEIGGYFSTGASGYNSLQLSLTRRTQAGLTVGANYTLAHGLDDVIGFSNEINDGYGVVPSRINKIDYGNSDLDIRNRGVFTANYALPRGNKLHGVEGLVGKGWQPAGRRLLQLQRSIPGARPGSAHSREPGGYWESNVWTKRLGSGKTKELGPCHRQSKEEKQRCMRQTVRTQCWM